MSVLLGPPVPPPAIAAALGDEASLECMLRVEAALARVLAGQGLIPASAADAIVRAAAAVAIDGERLREATERAGFPVVELVRQLREEAGEQAREHVHWGATTQDVLDTGLVLQLRETLRLIEEDLAGLIESLAGLAERHRGQVMAGRTHSQQALPITFGYKVATWLAPLLRHRKRLSELKPRLLVVQLGGAAGTLAAYGDDGPALYEALARELDLGLASCPWHSQRDGFVELAGWLALLSGSLGKLAQDVLLLAQSEVGEVREAADPTRGGSSAMPQKVNPVASERILAAARANAALLSILHQAMVTEHERGTHALQLERLALPQMVSLTASALADARFVSEHLVVDAGRMRENLAASQGTILAEPIRNALAAELGCDEAEALLKEACRIALAERRPLVSVLQERTAAALDGERLGDPSRYLGSANWFVDRILEEARRRW
jgi:3-carboxy-cis,cis-muconate cycloisomerase